MFKNSKNFKLKLISPFYLKEKPNHFMFPYGLGVLTGFLRSNNYNVVLDDLSVKIAEHNKKFWFSQTKKINLDLLRQWNRLIKYIAGDSKDEEIERFIEQIIQIIDYDKYDLIGISINSYLHFIPALLLSKKLKNSCKAKIVLGGPFITIHGSKLFELLPIADYMIVGDGQIPLLKLIESLEGKITIEEVPNLLYAENGTIRQNYKENFPIELLQIPDFSDFKLNFYLSGEIAEKKLSLPYQISRSCLYKCSFCGRNVLHKSAEFKSHKKVVKELKEMKLLYNSAFFYFRDEAVNLSYDYLNKLCDIFISEKMNLSWAAHCRPDNLDKNILYKMKDAGCLSLLFGVESGSAKILENMGKNFTIEQASSVLKYSHQSGIKNTIYIMSGYPHEQKDDIIKTVEFIKRNGQYIDRIILRFLQVHYGSPLYNDPDRFGIENLSNISNVFGELLFENFSFDETEGLKWKEKTKQTIYYGKIILRAHLRYNIFKKYKILFILCPVLIFYFWIIYFYLMRKDKRICFYHQNKHLAVLNWLLKHVYKKTKKYLPLVS